MSGVPPASASSFPGKREDEPPARIATPISSDRCGILFGEIRNDDVRAGSHEARKHFLNRAPFVEPALAGRGFEHRVFAAHVVNANRKIETFACRAHDIEVRKTRLDHENV